MMVAGKLEETTQMDSVPIQIKTSIEAYMYLSPTNFKLHQSACTVHQHVCSQAVWLPCLMEKQAYKLPSMKAISDWKIYKTYRLKRTLGRLLYR